MIFHFDKLKSLISGIYYQKATQVFLTYRAYNFSLERIIAAFVFIILFSLLYCQLSRKKTCSIYLFSSWLFLCYLGFDITVLCKKHAKFNYFDFSHLHYDREDNFQNITNIANAILFFVLCFLFGFIIKELPVLIKQLTMFFFTFGYSCFIEYSQFALEKGYGELDDIETAVVGSLIAIGLHTLIDIIVFLKPKIKAYKKSSHE